MPIYFWKIDRLRDHLIQQGLGQKALFIYIYIYVVISGAFLEFAFMLPVEIETTAADLIRALFNTALLAVGTYLCYYLNGAAAGREFAERYFSISLVVGLRMLVPVMLTGLLFGLIAGGRGSEDTIADDRWLDAAYVLLTTAYYWRVITHINIVARAR
jgi:hypothetical protein